MAMRLLDRQVSLLEYLTSSGAIFGDEEDVPLADALQGIDRGLLRLEACFSHEKRMEKVTAVFSRTFRLLGADQAAIVRDFTEACPPFDITRLENARQFYEFLCARWQHVSVEPPYLHDVAACEFACAKVRVGTREMEPKPSEQARGRGIRRQAGVVLLQCAYDIRPLFETGFGEIPRVKRDTRLAIAIPPGAMHPKVFGVPSPVFNLLAVLDDWTDPSAFGSAPEFDALICELAEHGLIAVRR